MSIVLEPLDGSNFISWSHTVKRALSVKNKAPLIDGSLSVLDDVADRVVYAAWVRANNLVLVWILNSIKPEIRKTLEYFTSAKAVWDELHARYTQSDDTHVYELEKSLSAISKGSQSLVSYYNLFKSLWDEWLSFRPSLHCSCGVMVNCTCELPQKVAKTRERDAIVKFLVGLDESYASIRSQILMQTSSMSLAKVYSLLLQEEAQRALKCESVHAIQNDSVAMMAKNGKFF